VSATGVEDGRYLHEPDKGNTDVRSAMALRLPIKTVLRGLPRLCLQILLLIEAALASVPSQVRQGTCSLDLPVMSRCYLRSSVRKDGDR